MNGIDSVGYGSAFSAEDEFCVGRDAAHAAHEAHGVHVADLKPFDDQVESLRFRVLFDLSLRRCREHAISTVFQDRGETCQVLWLPIKNSDRDVRRVHIRPLMAKIADRTMHLLHQKAKIQGAPQRFLGDRLFKTMLINN
ncbi:MAG TPA: hypothetical protein VGF85_03105 [Opitutaceae bacterium]